jgi:hypothetical protein
MPELGDIQIYDGKRWLTLATASVPDLAPPLGPVSIDPETVGLPPRMPVSPDPDEKDLVDTTELLEVLLCPECDYELGSPNPCGPTHLYLADHPLQHRLLRPLVEQHLRSLSTDRACAACSRGGVDVPIARGTCPHILIREEQVTMAQTTWDTMTDELIRSRGGVK